MSGGAAGSGGWKKSVDRWLPRKSARRGDQRRKWQSHQTHEPGRPADGSLSVNVRPFVDRIIAADRRFVGRHPVRSSWGMRWSGWSAAPPPPTATSAPDGANLAAQWCTRDGRQMLVATLGSGGNRGRILRRAISGTDENVPAPDGGGGGGCIHGDERAMVGTNDIFDDESDNFGGRGGGFDYGAHGENGSVGRLYINDPKMME